MPGLSELSPLYLACVTAAIAGGSTVCSHCNGSGFGLVKSLAVSYTHLAPSAARSI